MSEMKYCQGPKCHEYTTKDRIRGSKGDKHYETRKRSSFYYGNGNFCDQRCMYDWINKHIEHALDHFGRTYEPKRTDCDQAWYKDCKYLGWNDSNTDTRYAHYFVNDLLGEKISITQQQYQDDNFTAISFGLIPN
jgi:hypothetical protein